MPVPAAMLVKQLKVIPFCSNFSEVVEEVVKKPAEVVKVSLGGGGGLFGGDSSSDDDDSDEDSDES